MSAVAMYALAASLACLCLAAAVPPHSKTIETSYSKPVPDGKVHVYKYSAIVSAGQNEPARFGSKLHIQSKFYHKNEKIVGNAVHSYFKFDDVKYSIDNGPDDGHVHTEFQGLDDSIKIFEEPFVAVNDIHTDELLGIKVQDKEPIWSKNMKKSLASVGQLDIKQFKLEKNMKAYAFQSIEKTSHGVCNIDSSVYWREKNGKKLYYLRKSFEPTKCSNYFVHYTTIGRDSSCRADVQEPLVTSAERIYEFEHLDDRFKIRKIVSHEKISYLPWSHRSAQIQFVETNQTYEFLQEINESEANLPSVDLDKLSMHDTVIKKSNYIQNKTLGYVFQSKDQPPKSKELIELVKGFLLVTMDSLKTNNVDVEIESVYESTISKLYNAMSLMDQDSLIYIYKHFNFESEKGNTTRTIYLELMPHVGTDAAWNFVKWLITKCEDDKKPDVKVIVKILNKLPMFVQNPDEELLKSMQELLNLSGTIDKSVRDAAVMCYSILLHKTYKNVPVKIYDLLQKDIESFYNKIKNEPTYEAKVMFMMAMRNVEFGNIYKYLAPIVRGEDIFFVYVDIEKPEKYRVAAIWAVAQSISYDKKLTYDLFWPLLVNETEPLTIRIAAYEQLVTRNPILDMSLLMDVYWLMAEEKDPHIFNYHYTTLKFMAETTDPCMKFKSELMRKVLRLTQKRVDLSSALSSVKVYDYYDDVYGHGKTYRVGLGMNEHSGIPQIGHYEEISTLARRSQLNKGYFWNVDGINLHSIIKIAKNLITSEDFVEFKEEFFGISDEKIRSLLKLTEGYKLLDKHIHVEFWTMNHGFVTEVKVLFKENLQTYIKDWINEYKPDSVMDVTEKLNRDWLDISFENNYKAVVMTDIGLPVLFFNEFPKLTYTKLKPSIFPSKSTISASLKFLTKYNRHGSYQMKFFNPFADVTHSVIRHTEVDVSFPLELTVSFNEENRSFKVFYPRLPEAKSLVGGLRVRTVDQVKIGKDHLNKLKKHCPNCKHVTEVTRGPSYKTNVENVFDSPDTGLEYKSLIFDCENYDRIGEEYEELYRILLTTQNIAEENLFEAVSMKIHHVLFNLFNAPFVSSCGVIAKISPSKVYPTSHIEIEWRFNMEKVQDRMKLNFRGSFDAKAMFTNVTTRYWDMNIDTDLSKTLQAVNLHFIRKAADEKNLHFCLEATKTLSDFFAEPSSKLESTTGFQFNMGYSNEDKCVNDETLIKVKIKSELSDKQIEHADALAKSGSCLKNPLNPLEFNKQQLFDWNCLHEAVKATTLKKYTIDASYQKVPYELVAKLISIEDSFRFENLAHLSYKPNHTEVGTSKAIVIYDRNYVNVTVLHPTYSYEMKGVAYKSKDNEKNDAYSDILLENVGFPISFLADYYKGDIRPCIAHSNEIITDLNQTVPMDLKDWTLMYGDHEFMSYAVLVKKDIGNKVAVRVYVGSHTLEMSEGSEAETIVKFDGVDVKDYAKITLPKDEDPELKLRKMNEMIVVDINKYSEVKVYYTPYNVIVTPHIVLDRNVDGICGHMGSIAYVQKESLVYTST